MAKSSQKSVLITGGARRIGAEIAVKLAGEGFDIALHYNRSRKEALKVVKAVQNLGRQCHLFQCDLGNEKDANQLVKAVVKKFPGLMLLVNNASLFEKSSIKQASLKSWNQHMNINFKAPFILIQGFAKACRKGSVINILDTNVSKDETQHTTYLLSKKALTELTRMAAVELAPNIRVNGIAPGFILAPEGAKSGYLKRLKEKIPLRKKGEPAYIADTVMFLVQNPYITGEIIFVDGGEHLSKK
ncbi:MAG: SDR family oxidoreductase [Candidatus Omnitrophica bacterium]|nr:SDR family oxidoreductase [Candidatus Omnitrophota bacterium]